MASVHNLSASASLTVLLLLAAPAHAEMRPGRWETTMTMEMSGMPMAMPPITVANCVKAEDVGKAPPIPNDSNCKVSAYKADSDGATWTMTCTGEMAMTGTGSMSFAGDTYSGVMTMNMTRPDGPPVNVKQTMKGKRLGDC